MFHFLSYKKNPLFLLLLGLNFINPLHAEYQSGPAHYFADKLEAVPQREFYDVLKIGNSLWFAGQGLGVLKNGQWTDVYADGRYTALVTDPEGKKLWVAGKNGIYMMNSNSHLVEATQEVEVGFIWDLVFRDGRLWFVGSSGFGWIDPVEFELGALFEKSMEPRPFTLNSVEGINGVLVGLYSGLWRLGDSGAELLITGDATNGSVVTWIARGHEGFVLGSTNALYSWSGVKGEAPIAVDSNYSSFFKKGVGNGVELNETVLIADFSAGVAVLDKGTLSVSAYFSEQSGLGIGNTYKIDLGQDNEVIALGTGGVARLDMASESIFFPSTSLLSGEVITSKAGDEKGVYLFTENSWIHLTHLGYILGQTKGVPNWAGVSPNGSIFYGIGFKIRILENEVWETKTLPEPVFDLKWGSRIALASGQNGLYTVTEDLGMELIYPADQEMKILGELGDTFYALGQDGLLLSLTNKGEVWRFDEIRKSLPGSYRHSAVRPNEIILSVEDGLYRISNTGELSEIPIQEGWEVRGVAANDAAAYVSWYNAEGDQHGISVYKGDKTHMLAVPYLDRCGEPIDLISNNTHLGVIGENGVGWFVLDEMEPVYVPDVEFDLFMEEEPVADRTIKSGMHFIDLQAQSNRPEVPSQVQYRINEGRWQDLKDPSLPFAGHGEFVVEMRAIHPNGMSSESRRIQFGIAPPWYLNPVYQGVMFVLILFLFWGVYMLRHAQLKKRNLWLEDEVRKATRELEAANAARINFLAGLSHDIRNPLNGVLMIAETLTRDPPRSGDDSRLKDLTEFGIIVDRMLGEILDFSAIDQANLPMALIPVSISDILSSSVQQNQFNIQKALVNISLAIDPELKEVVIKTDRNWMIKILTNLIVNALEYSDSERVEVGAKCHRLSPEYVELEIFVKDWGKGIDDAEKAFVFERFYRGESGIDSGKHGTGLGLSICQDVAHAMGAHLALADNDPSGCHFFLKGRFARVAGATELDQDAVLSQLRGKKVLIVDDLAYNRRSIVDFFKTMGCDCDDCENGREALQMLGDNSYDLALLDWDLPGLMGPEIAAIHRHKHPEDKVTIIALTAYTDGEKLRESEQAGMNGYISKPLTASRLAYALANIEDKQPQSPSAMDTVDSEELNEEIYKHIADCVEYGQQSEWENLRRCAHRLTTLALMRNNPAMQQVCRDLQVSAQAGNLEEIHIGIAELQQWGRG